MTSRALATIIAERHGRSCAVGQRIACSKCRCDSCVLTATARAAIGLSDCVEFVEGRVRIKSYRGAKLLGPSDGRDPASGMGEKLKAEILEQREEVLEERDATAYFVRRTAVVN